MSGPLMAWRLLFAASVLWVGFSHAQSPQSQSQSKPQQQSQSQPQSQPSPRAAMTVEEPRWFKASFLDIREDISEATRSGRRLMLYFQQDGCPYCTKLLRDNFGRKAIADKTRRHFDVVSINMWGDREVTDLAGQATTEKAFARAMRVQFTPTLVIFDEQGNVAQRINGYLPPAQFVAALERSAPAAAADHSAPAPVARSRGNDVITEIIRSDATDPAPSLSSVRPERRLAKRLADDPRPLLVIFEEPECGTCAEMQNVGFRRPEVAAQLRQLHVVRLDRNAAARLQTPRGEIVSARDWARTLNVFYLPTLVFFDASGAEIFRVDAYLRPFHLSAAIEYVLSGAHRTQPEFQRFIEARAAERRARGERIDLMR